MAGKIANKGGNLLRIGFKKNQPGDAAATPKPAARKAPKLVKKRTKKQKMHSYQTYIYKVLRELKPNHGITHKAMEVMNTFVDDMYRRISKDASDLVLRSGKKIMMPADIKSAVMLNLDRDLAKHAMHEAERALNDLAKNY